MPAKHPKNRKLDALELLSFGLPIHAVHKSTGVPSRTLYRWRKQLEQRQQRFSAKQDSSLLANLPHSPDFRHIDEELRHETPVPRHNPVAIDQASPQNDQSDTPDNESQNRDYEDLSFIRAQLMKCARELAVDLESVGPDINIRSLALSRVLDRIQWLDQILPSQSNELVIRHEYYTDGAQTKAPPWALGEDNPLEFAYNKIHGID